MPTDVNQRGKAIVDLAAGLVEVPDPDIGKDADAVARGRRGGRKGGTARASKLIAEERRRIAKQASEARWRGKST